MSWMPVADPWAGVCRRRQSFAPIARVRRSFSRYQRSKANAQ
jgi:hypothetical protein